MTWREVTFGSVCNLVNGRAYSERDWATSGTPIIRIQNLNDARSTFNYWPGSLDKQVHVRSGDVLLAWSGTPGTSFGAHVWNGSEGVLNQHIFRVDLDEKHVTKEWAVRAVNYRLYRLIAGAHGGVGLKHVTRPAVQSLSIPLPPLPEQKRIAAILNAADTLREKRRQAIEDVTTLRTAIFVDLFGDLGSSTRPWPALQLGSVLSGIQSGWSPVCLDRPATENEWGVLKLGAVTWCEYDETANKALPADVSPDPDLEVRPGDLLFTRKNTYDLVGACALVRKTRSLLMFPDLVYRLRISDTAPLLPVYLHQVLTFPAKRRTIQQLAGGSAGSMPNISKERLRSVRIPVPPIGLQRLYATRIAAHEELEAKQQRASDWIDHLRFSLQQRAFRGEL